MPALGGLALVYLWPLVQMLLYSFQNYGLPQVTGAAPVQWVGFGNFSSTFADSEFGSRCGSRSSSPRWSCR